MTATNQEEQTALTLPQRAAVALGDAVNIIKLRELAAQSAGIVSVTNDDGRAEAHRAGMVLRSTRTNITNTGKAAREDATAFSKAVIALEKELVAIIEPEEQRVLALRDAFDEQIAAEKAKKIAEERARVERIQSDIAAIRDTALSVAGKSSEIIGAAIDVLEEIHPTQERFEEFSDDAAKVIGDTLDKLLAMNESALAAEKAAADAEAARLAEIARLTAERAELEKLRAEQAERERIAKIESDRIAAEQAAEAKRLADIAAAQQAEIAAAQRKLAEQQAAADKRDADAAAAIKAVEAVALAKERDAQRREDDHGPALEMNAAFDAERLAESERLQACADQHLVDAAESAADERKCGMAPGALRDLAAHLDDIGLFPDDSEIVAEIRAMFMTQWGMDQDQADARMSRFVWAEAVVA